MCGQIAGSARANQAGRELGQLAHVTTGDGVGDLGQPGNGCRGRAADQFVAFTGRRRRDGA
jgi:hypothetical protein